MPIPRSPVGAVWNNPDMAAGTTPERRPRVLMTKIGFDGHDRGSRLVATFLRDAGYQVIYTGPWQDVTAVVATAGAGCTHGEICGALRDELGFGRPLVTV